MQRVWQRAATLAAGVVVSAMYATPQAYTISAKPGAVNYIEGNVFIDSKPVTDKGLRSVFLNANETLSTDVGKAEVLLAPGIFLRVGSNSAVRMVSPSLTNTQLEVKRGEIIVEAAGLMKDTTVEVMDRGASATIDRNGLYRFSADEPPTAATIDGRMNVFLGEQKVELTKGRETQVSGALKAHKFDAKKEDELYAWSNVRAQYDAAASYQAASTVSAANAGAWGGFGFGPMFAPGWFYNTAFDSWAWLPGTGAFYSPFGWGFYSPGAVMYAPVVSAPIWRGASGGGGTVTRAAQWWLNHGGTAPAAGHVQNAVVAVNPNNPPALGSVSASPWQNQVQRAQVAAAFNQVGYRAVGGGPALAFSGNGVGGTHANWSGGATHAGWAGVGGSAGGVSHAGGFSGGAAGGAHSAGGASTGGGGHR